MGSGVNLGRVLEVFDVLVSSRRGLAVLSLAATLMLVAGQTVRAQTPAAPAQGKNWQPGEYDMYQAITKETQPAKRLELLDAWKAKVPNSDYSDVRNQAYLQAY